LVAFFDDRPGLISHAIILPALFDEGSLSELRKSLIRIATAPDDAGNQQSQGHGDSTQPVDLLHGHFSIGKRLGPEATAEHV
jgi:hypothetical protein